MTKISIKIVVLLLPAIAMAFTPPDEKTIRNAIGDLNGLPAVFQRVFTPDKNGFDPIPEPRPGDWLAVHNERGQTFDEFKASQPNQPGQKQHIIYLQRSGISHLSTVPPTTNYASLRLHFSR